MNSAQHRTRAEQLLVEVNTLIEAVASGRVAQSDEEIQALRLAALVSYAQVQAHATLALYPDGTQPIMTIKTF